MTKKHYIVANAGDTRCVLATDGTVKRITEDHKPKLPRENKRIEDAGGTVAHGRVREACSPSRAVSATRRARSSRRARVARVARVCFAGARARARVCVCVCVCVCLSAQKLKVNPKVVHEQMVSPEPDIFSYRAQSGRRVHRASRATASSTCSRTRTRAFTSAGFTRAPILRPPPPTLSCWDAPLSVGLYLGGERGTRGEPELEAINEKLLDECLRKHGACDKCRRSCGLPGRVGGKRQACAQLRQRAPLTYAHLPRAPRAATDEEGHVSARYIIEWKPDDVIRWLEAVGYGEAGSGRVWCVDAL